MKQTVGWWRDCGTRKSVGKLGHCTAWGSVGGELRGVLWVVVRMLALWVKWDGEEWNTSESVGRGWLWGEVWLLERVWGI